MLIEIKFIIRSRLELANESEAAGHSDHTRVELTTLGDGMKGMAIVFWGIHDGSDENPINIRFGIDEKLIKFYMICWLKRFPAKNPVKSHAKACTCTLIKKDT